MLCYAAGFLWAVLPAFGWNEYRLEGAGVSCSVNWADQSVVFASYIYTIFVACFLIPACGMIYSYLGIVKTVSV